MPGSGGSYLLLKVGFKNSRLGSLLPLLFIWQFIASGPLEVGSSYIGFAQYLAYFFPEWGPWQNRLLVIVLGLLTIVLLYRQIHAIDKLILLLSAGMLLPLDAIIVIGLIH